MNKYTDKDAIDDLSLVVSKIRSSGDEITVDDRDIAVEVLTFIEKTLSERTKERK